MADNIADNPKFNQGIASRAKKPSPLGTAIFVGLQTADVALQYGIFHTGWGAQLIQRLGGRVVPLVGRQYFGLTPYAAILASFAAGTTLKQNINLLTISEQQMKPSSALVISALNIVLNSLNSLLSLWAVTSMAPVVNSPSATILDVCVASPVISLGIGLYTVGMFTELFSEIQRLLFKKNPANKGKPYGGGLFSLATNINYGGYTIWRTGYAIAAAGFPLGLVIGGFFFWDFTTRAIPELDEYCTLRVRNSFRPNVSSFLFKLA